jgi:hypothetical protein
MPGCAALNLGRRLAPAIAPPADRLGSHPWVDIVTRAVALPDTGKALEPEELHWTRPR